MISWRRGGSASVVIPRCRCLDIARLIEVDVRLLWARGGVANCGVKVVRCETLCGNENGVKLLCLFLVTTKTDFTVLQFKNFHE